VPDPLVLDCFSLFGPVPPRGVPPLGTGELLAQMRRHSVAGSIALSTRGLYYGSSAGNRETAALCGQSGGVLQPAAILDPRVSVTAQAISGARMLCLMPTTQRWPLPFAPLDELLSSLRDTHPKVPIFWEATRTGDATRILQAVTAAGNANQMLLGGVTGDSLIEAISIARRDNRFGIITNGLHGIGEISMAVDAIGASRVYFGSGAPVQSMGGALAVIRYAGLSDENLAAILGENAKRLIAAGGVAA